MKQLKIGRNDDNDIVIKNQSVSRYHAIIHITDTYIIFEDLESSNGSFVNGNRVTRPTEITDRSIIKVGTELVPWKTYLSDTNIKSEEKEKIETELKPEDITDINIPEQLTEISKDEKSKTKIVVDVYPPLNPQNTTKTLSIIGFILSILGLLSSPFFILGILAIIFSSIGISKEKNGLAIAGLIISIISIVLGIIIAIMIF
jgi:hypothetical protein